MNDDQTRLLSEILAQMKADAEAYAEFRVRVLKNGEITDSDNTKWRAQCDRKQASYDDWNKWSAVATAIFRLLVLYLLYNIWTEVSHTGL